MDRKAARRRRDLDDRGAVVTRIAAAPPIELHTFRSSPLFRLGLAPAALVRGVWRSKLLAF